MTDRTTGALGTMLVALAIGGGALAAPAQTVPPSLLACARLADDGERLRCFDREIQSLSHAPAPPASQAAAPVPAPVPSAGPVPQSPPAPADTFGRPNKPKPAPEAKTLTAHIISVQAGGDHPRFGLDNGQTWQQAEADDKFQAKVGDPVTLSKGLLGSYFMSAGTHAAVRVTRVK